MSRSVPLCSPLHFPLQLCAMMILHDLSLELVKLDIDEIESYLCKFDLADTPTVKMMSAGFKCPTSALPFGALRSDWSRLLLLHEAQPDGSIIKQKLVQLMRILIIAYYQMEEHFDVIGRDTPSLQVSKKCARETPTMSDTSTLRGLNDSYLANETSNNNPSNYYNVRSKVNSSAAETESTTTKSVSSTSELFTVVRASPGHQNTITSSTDRDTTVEPRYSNAVLTTVASKILRNCRMHPTKSIGVRKHSNGAHNKIYENLRSKPRYSGPTHGANEVYVTNRVGISPATNEFWRYVTPAPAPFTMANVTSAYRVRRLSGTRSRGNARVRG